MGGDRDQAPRPRPVLPFGFRHPQQRPQHVIRVGARSRPRPGHHRLRRRAIQPDRGAGAQHPPDQRIIHRQHCLAFHGMRILGAVGNVVQPGAMNLGRFQHHFGVARRTLPGLRRGRRIQRVAPDVAVALGSRPAVPPDWRHRVESRPSDWSNRGLLCAHARTRSAGLVLWLSYKLSPQSIAAEAKEDWGAAPNPARGRAPGPHHLLGQS